MSIPVRRLYLGSVDGFLPGDAPFHGYVIEHPRGVVLVDTGISPSPSHWPARARERKLVARAIDEALADHGLGVADVAYLINTHLDHDHCGQNAAFPGVPVIVQERELARARRMHSEAPEWFDWVNARLELVDGDAEVLPGVQVLFTPGHTEGHQSVLVSDDVRELLIGDAAYSDDLWEDPDNYRQGHPLWAPVNPERGQIRTGYDEWRASLDRLRSLDVDAAHLCHSATIFRP